MSNSIKLDKKSLSDALAKVTWIANAYAVIWFLLLLTAVYGFVALKILEANGAQPSQDAINSQVQAAATPHIDAKVVDQMQSLQDNSVNVKTLFDQARSNPFHE